MLVLLYYLIYFSIFIYFLHNLSLKVFGALKNSSGNKNLDILSLSKGSIIVNSKLDITDSTPTDSDKLLTEVSESLKNYDDPNFPVDKNSIAVSVSGLFFMIFIIFQIFIFISLNFYLLQIHHLLLKRMIMMLATLLFLFLL